MTVSQKRLHRVVS